MGDITIRRQVLEVDLQGGEEADGLALQRRLPGVCAGVLSPAIEAALGALDPGDAYLSLDRVAIDVRLDPIAGLGGFGVAGGFESEMANAVQRELREHFRQHPPPAAPPREGPAPAGGPAPLGRPASGEGRSSGGSSSSAAASGLGEPGRPFGPGGPGGPGDVRYRTFGQTVDDALDTFLCTGRLPWSFRLPSGRTLEQVVQGAWWDAWGHRDPPPATRDRLRTLLARPEARERLSLQFTPGFVRAVLSSLSPDAAAVLAQIEATLDGADSAPPTGRAFIRQVRVTAIESAVTGHRPPAFPLVRSAWTALSARLADPALAAVLERAWPGSTSCPRAPVEASRRADRPGAADRAAPPDAGENSGLLVDCAGIVLLHPFLPRFFEGLGVATGSDLIDPGRAACLLHHLATGELTAPEHRVTLAKVLCGLPLGQPVEADARLTEGEMDEATALLEAAIRHWEALRSTTPGGLRAEFLQRPGVLSVTSGGDWLLRIESRTADILLDQLPWGYSPVWLPWMSHLMMVEWR